MKDMFKKTIKTREGIDLYYERYNADNTKPNNPIVFFLHGAGGDLDAWEYVKDDLLNKGFSSIAMDLRGHGYSTHPKNFESYHVDKLAEDMNFILETEKIDKINLIGHCYGSVIAMHFAFKHPDKVQKLSIISGSYKAPDYMSSKILRSFCCGLINALAFISLPPINPGHSIYPPGKFHRDYELFGLVKTILRNSWRSYLLTSKEIVTLNIGEHLKDIDVPTLVLVGEKDSIFPPHISEKIHKAIKNSKFEIIPDGNHVIILNNISQVSNSLCTFLNES